MSTFGHASHPPPEPDFWIYFANYLRNAWVQWAIVFIPFFMFALYLKLTMPVTPTNEKEHPGEEAHFEEKKRDRKRKSM
ncbi:hypothetical protein, conserved [Plasmodium gonderi]|uniref:Transmembrane protein n=1 Tax=Plasmodium gonderi TaxID=77519 RepID=A0A1Y1JNC3_PLAGO|nr:hypothetical protein, conserved [Plasmodium gonderi]GAW81903.1 hypothetical protein, conserved [Plasmodium gonderi]